MQAFLRCNAAHNVNLFAVLGCLLILIPLSWVLSLYGWDGLMRTTKYADADVWLSRSAGVAGPILLGLSGVVVTRC